MKSLAQFSQDLRRLPRVVAQRVAEESASAITDAAKRTFDASEDPYGEPWALGAKGQVVTLDKTGALAKFVVYVAIGTKLRVSLGVPYAKYQIGKRRVYPRQGEDLPDEYVQALERTAVRVVKEELYR